MIDEHVELVLRRSAIIRRVADIHVSDLVDALEWDAGPQKMGWFWVSLKGDRILTDRCSWNTSHLEYKYQDAIISFQAERRDNQFLVEATPKPDPAKDELRAKPEKFLGIPELLHPKHSRGKKLDSYPRRHCRHCLGLNLVKPDLDVWLCAHCKATNNI